MRAFKSYTDEAVQHNAGFDDVDLAEVQVAPASQKHVLTVDLMRAADIRGVDFRVN